MRSAEWGPVKLALYHFFHVGSLMLLAAALFAAIGKPAATKKRTMMITGILSLIVLVTGFGMLAVMHYGFRGWVIVKLVCWLGLAALPGMAYRRGAGWVAPAAVILILTAVAMVYFQPF